MEDRSSEPKRDDTKIAFLYRLADGLAHEIKNPLSTMSINLTLLQEDWERAGAALEQKRKTNAGAARRAVTASGRTAHRP